MHGEFEVSSLKDILNVCQACYHLYVRTKCAYNSTTYVIAVVGQSQLPGGTAEHTFQHLCLLFCRSNQDAREAKFGNVSHSRGEILNLSI